MTKIRSDIDTPALLIDFAKVEQNIERMQNLADNNQINLRPHIKTHKIPFLAKHQIDKGAIGIATAKIGEAEVMAKHGITDIQIANIIIGLEKISRLIKLSDKVNKLSCCVDSEIGLSNLSGMFANAGRTIDVFIKIDTGFHRCGLERYDEILALCRKAQIAKGIRLVGILTHAGHVYSASDVDEVKNIGFNESRQMIELAERLDSDGISINEISVGSTPGARFAATVKGITEMRVGNYIYNDMIQVKLGSAQVDDCALSVLATVISKPASDRIILDSGSKALGLDIGAHGSWTCSGHGSIIGKNAEIYRLSEEHATVRHNGEKFDIGEKVRIIPNHACAVSNLFDFVYLIFDNDRVEKTEIKARGKMN